MVHPLFWVAITAGTALLVLGVRSIRRAVAEPSPVHDRGAAMGCVGVSTAAALCLAALYLDHAAPLEWLLVAALAGALAAGGFAQRSGSFLSACAHAVVAAAPGVLLAMILPPVRGVYDRHAAAKAGLPPAVTAPPR